jgi:hypothetical protein
MFVFGALMLSLGLFEVGRIVVWLFMGGVIIDRELLLLCLLILGGYALYELVQRVPILLVRTVRGSRRLEFRRPVSPEQLQEFARALEMELGCRVDVRL